MNIKLKNCTPEPIHFREKSGKITVLQSEGWVVVPGQQRVLEESHILPFKYWQNAPDPEEPDVVFPPVLPGEVIIVMKEVLDFAQKSTGRANKLWREHRLFAPGEEEWEGAVQEGGRTIVQHFVRA